MRLSERTLGALYFVRVKTGRTTLSAVVNSYIAGDRHFRRLLISGGLVQGTVFKQADFRNSIFADLSLSISLFEECDLTESLFRGIRVGGAVTFRNCDLSRAKFDRATLSGVVFERCNLFGSSFYAGSIDSTVFHETRLQYARFTDTTIRRTLFERSTSRHINIDSVIFIGCNVSEFATDEAVSFSSPSTLDWTTICESLGGLKLESLLVRSGMPELFATYAVSCARALDPNLLYKFMRSTFISYGAPDAAFAWRLRDDLKRNGVHTFFFATDAVPGERLHELMRTGVNRFDRVIVVCSKDALGRPGLRNEVTEAFAREARAGGASYVIPITIDKHVFTSSDDLAVILRDRVIADFSDQSHYQDSFLSLLESLRTNLRDGGGA